MNCVLPTVTRVGHFDSRKQLAGVRETTPRVPETYELEMFTADCGTAFLDGEQRCPADGAFVADAVACKRAGGGESHAAVQ